MDLDLVPTGSVTYTADIALFTLTARLHELVLAATSPITFTTGLSEATIRGGLLDRIRLGGYIHWIS